MTMPICLWSGPRNVSTALMQRQANDPSCVLFIKHMAHHLVDLNDAFLQSTRNIFLIRDPREMLPSLNVQLPNATLTDTGLKRQWDLYSDLINAGQAPVILDSRELRLDPGAVISKLCGVLEIEFKDDMLNWPAGARAEDGVWAPHWYHAVHKSTGFAPYTAKTQFPEALQSLLDDCAPFYEKLFEHALRAES